MRRGNLFGMTIAVLITLTVTQNVPYILLAIATGGKGLNLQMILGAFHAPLRYIYFVFL